MNGSMPRGTLHARTRVFAHRGDSAHAPENTLPAFDLAVRSGTDVLETDVHWTRDGVIVVAHDSDISRTSNGSGLIADLTYAELQRFDFGYQFSPDGGLTFPYRGQGLRIPRFSELLRTFPDIDVNVDIKPKQPRSLRGLIREVHACRAVDRIMVASFNHRVLRLFRNLCSSIATSASPIEIGQALFSERTRCPIKGNSLPYQSIQIPLRSHHLPIATSGLIRWAHDRGIAVDVWTIDEADDMKRLFELGVDGIVTNQPYLAVMTRRAYFNDFNDFNGTYK